MTDYQLEAGSVAGDKKGACSKLVAKQSFVVRKSIEPFGQIQLT